MDKKSFRSFCLTKLKKSQNFNAYMRDKLVQQKIDLVISHHNPKRILFYLPLKLEVNVVDLLNKYRKKLKIFTPFIEGESFKMVQFRLPLRRNSVGIQEPSNSLKVNKEVDMIIVPVVGIDGDYRRVGFGKGMYDRFYEKLQKKPIVVFVQRTKCKCREKITDHYDIQADYYITPKELNIIGKLNDNRDDLSRRGCRRWRSTSVF